MEFVESIYFNFSMVELDSIVRELLLFGVFEFEELLLMIFVVIIFLEVYSFDLVEVLDILEEKEEGINGDVKNELESYFEDQIQQIVEDSGSFQDLGDNSIGKDKVGILNKDLEDGENVGKMDKGND